MKAIVLVGGEGTRLRPLTFTTPKQMLPVAGRPMIERVVEHLSRHGIDEVVLSLGYQPAAFVAAYPDARCAGTRLVYAVEPEPLDTGGAVAFAARHAGLEETFVVVNGDVLSGVDLTALVAFHRRRGAEGTIHLIPVEDPSRFGVVPTDPEGRVTDFIEKPPAGQASTNLINAGTYVLEPAVLERIGPDRRVSIERETFPAMAADRTLFACAEATEWVDAGTPATYLAVNLAIAGRERSSTHPSARVHPDARVVNSVLGAGVVVGPGAVVEDSVVMLGTQVGEASTVRGSILGRNVVIGRGAMVHELTVLGDEEVVGEGALLQGERRPAVTA